MVSQLVARAAESYFEWPNPLCFPSCRNWPSPVAVPRLFVAFFGERYDRHVALLDCINNCCFTVVTPPRYSEPTLLLCFAVYSE